MLAPVTFDHSILLHCDTEPGAALAFALLPARTHQQQLAMEMLRVRGADVQSVYTDAATATRWLHVTARGGPLQVELDAQVRLLQAEPGPRGAGADVHPAPLSAPESLRYLMPSRWCPSDRLTALAEREFVGIDEPFARAIAVEGWIGRHLAPRRADAPAGTAPGAAPVRSVGAVLRSGDGTPTELAHLMIALCRAARLPARYVTSVPFGIPDACDLHPWVEVLVDDAWIAFEPAGLVPRTALLRIGTGRDAADVPLAVAHGATAAWRVRMSLACVGTTAEALRARDRDARAIGSATLGSLGEAVRWHQEARRAARRDPDEPVDAPQREAPSRAVRSVARAATAPRRGAEVLVFPSPPPGRPSGTPIGTRT